MNAEQRPEGLQSPSPEGPPGGSVTFLCSSLGFVASRSLKAALAPLALDPRHFGVLNLVATNEGISQRAMTKPLGIPASRLVALVDDLEARGLIERSRNPEDRRAYALGLTTNGRETLNAARRVARQNEQRFCSPLQPTEREQLLDLLRRLAAGQDLPSGVHPGLATSDDNTA
jgi:DNA-binding MarR family transcriptional regulator